MFIVCFYANKLDLDTTSVHFNMAFCSCLVCNASWLKGEKNRLVLLPYFTPSLHTFS